MSRHFLANLSVILLLNVIIKPIYIFGIEVSVQNAVGASSYGLYFAILNSAYLLQVLNDFGLQIYNNRNVALSSDALRTSFTPILKVKAGLSILFILLFVILTGLLGYWDEWQLILAVGLNLILMSLVLFLRSNISGLGLYRYDSLLSVLDKGLLILILGYLLFLSAKDFSILHFAYGQTVALVLTALTAVAMLVKKHAFSSQQSKEVQERAVSILKKAGPFALAVFLMTIYTRIDGVMIEQLAEDGAFQSGAYAAGYRLLDAANMFAYLFAVLLLPMFTRNLGDPAAIQTLLSQGARLMLTLTVTAATACIIYREEIMQLLYFQSTREWGDIFGLLMGSFIAIGGMYIFGTYLTARGDIRKLNILYVTCVALNIILNWVMIPSLGAQGAAMATLLTQSTATVSLVIMTVRSTEISFDKKRLLQTGAFILFCAAITFGSLHVEGIHWTIRFVALAILMPLASLVTGVINRHELRQFIPR